MGFKTGLIVGAGIGYVLGTKAGRERFDEFVAMWERAQENPAVADVMEATERPRNEAMRLLGDGIRSVSDVLKNQAENR